MKKEPINLVIIETPYAGDVDGNVYYAKQCMEESLRRGEAPLLSHLLYTQVLDDKIPAERDLGMYAGWAWLSVAEKHVFYIDKGVSKGMRHALAISNSVGREVEFRKLGVKRTIHKDLVIFD